MTNRQTYVVTREHVGHVMSVAMAKTWPKAIRDMRDAVYDLHEANGTRDRDCAWRDMGTVARLTSDVAMVTIDRGDMGTITLQRI